MIKTFKFTIWFSFYILFNLNDTGNIICFHGNINGNIIRCHGNKKGNIINSSDNTNDNNNRPMLIFAVFMITLMVILMFKLSLYEKTFGIDHWAARTSFVWDF